jgi:hypothetical protein
MGQREVIMKTGITITIVALGLALFAAPDTPARAWWWWHHGPDVSLELSGSNFTTSSQDSVAGEEEDYGTPSLLGAVSTSLQSGIAKGKSGSPIFSAQTVIDAGVPGFEGCGGLPGANLSTTSVFTYKDGSILSVTTDDEKSFYCFLPTVFDPPGDPMGTPIAGIFSVQFEGIVTGGTRRFEGATGTWVGSAEAEDGRVTAHVEIDLD